MGRTWHEVPTMVPTKVATTVDTKNRGPQIRVAPILAIPQRHRTSRCVPLFLSVTHRVTHRSVTSLTCGNAPRYAERRGCDTSLSCLLRIASLSGVSVGPAYLSLTETEVCYDVNNGVSQCHSVTPTTSIHPSTCINNPIQAVTLRRLKASHKVSHSPRREPDPCLRKIHPR